LFIVPLVVFQTTRSVSWAGLMVSLLAAPLGTQKVILVLAAVCGGVGVWQGVFAGKPAPIGDCER
jgi:uncharacterized membrane protein